jgi:Negative regulator of sigma F
MNGFSFESACLAFVAVTICRLSANLLIESQRLLFAGPDSMTKEHPMTCCEIDDLIDATPGDLAATPQITEHLNQCRGCSALIGALGEARPRAALPRTSISRIEATILKNLKPVRPLPSIPILLFACATIFLGVVWSGAEVLGMTGWHALSPAQRTVVFTALAAGGLLLAFSMIGQMMPGSKYAVAPRSVLIATLAGVLIIVAVMFRPRAESAFVPVGLVCLKNGLTYSIPALVLFGALVRFGAMLNTKVIGAAAGALAGFAGLAALEMNCPNLNVFHRLVWHCGVVLISSGVGTLFGAVVEQIR